MAELKLKPGDTIYHKSDPRCVWVVERIEEDKVYCSRVEDNKIAYVWMNMIAIGKASDRNFVR